MKQKVEIEIIGGFRNAGIILETKSIRLDQNFKFSGNIDLISPKVDGVAVIKGGRHATYTIKIKINNITKEIPGYIKEKNGRQVENIDFDFSDFNLTTPPGTIA